MISNNNNGKGNPYHDEDGKFTTAGNTGTNEEADEKDASSDNAQPQSFVKKNFSSFFKKKDSLDKTEPGKLSETFEKFKKDRVFRERKKRTVEETVEIVAKFFDEDVLKELEKYNFKLADSMGAVYTSHASSNQVLVQAISRKMFRPTKLLEDKEFFDLVNKSKINTAGNWRLNPQSTLGFIQRGFYDPDMLKQYSGEKDMNVILPFGMYGSCVYTAYDNYNTAIMYANGKYLMETVVDNEKGNTIRQQQYSVLRNQFLRKVNEMKSKIENEMKAKGHDDEYAQKVSRIFEKTATYDYTFPALLMGYDGIWEEGANYYLLLNFGNTYTRKNLRNEG